MAYKPSHSFRLDSLGKVFCGAADNQTEKQEGACHAEHEKVLCREQYMAYSPYRSLKAEKGIC